MKIKTWIKYEEPYLPPRCRKWRYREREEYVWYSIREVSLSDLSLAFEDNSFHGKGSIYFYGGKLYAKVKSGEVMSHPEERGCDSPLQELIRCREKSSQFFPRVYRDGQHPDRRKILSAVKSANAHYLIVDGELYRTTEEPRYVVQTFGLGFNHGGTGLFVEYYYNSNIGKDNYFSALEGDQAVAWANHVAASRGDTNNVGNFEKMIVCHMPEIVKVKPKRQHGDGDKFLNDVESLIRASDNAVEAGFLSLALLLAGKN